MHISLDQAIGRQPRLNRVGESIASIAGSDLAYAYSLRSLTGGDPEVVEVRRDTGGGAGDNDEKKFTASALESGELADWVGTGNDGYVKTLFSQAGERVTNSNMVNLSKAGQPRIVSNGSYLGYIDFYNDNVNLQVAESDTSIAPAGDKTMFTVAADSETTSSPTVLTSVDTSFSFYQYFGYRQFSTSGAGQIITNTNAVTLDQFNQFTASFSGTNTSFVEKNGSNKQLGNLLTGSPIGTFVLGGGGVYSLDSEHFFKEFIVVNGVDADVQTAIETNQINAFNTPS